MFAQKINSMYNKISHMTQRKYIPKYLLHKADFLSDTARIFDLYCALYKDNLNSEKEDYESILSDWMVTGQDIENAIVQLEKTI